MRQSLDAESPTVISGAVNLSSPLVSPDGRWLVATDGVKRQVVRLPVEGGEAELVVRRTLSSEDAAWTTDGTLWFSDDDELGVIVGDSLAVRVWGPTAGCSGRCR